uniref:Uncharacterized protein n=1 Tax=Anopheles culicifacies TaxID=139723 RepID=A0A182M8K4_9DIPT
STPESNEATGVDRSQSKHPEYSRVNRSNRSRSEHSGVDGTPESDPEFYRSRIRFPITEFPSLVPAGGSSINKALGQPFLVAWFRLEMSFTGRYSNLLTNHGSKIKLSFM